MRIDVRTALGMSTGLVSKEGQQRSGRLNTARFAICGTKDLRYEGEVSVRTNAVRAASKRCRASSMRCRSSHFIVTPPVVNRAQDLYRDARAASGVSTGLAPK